MPSKEEECLPMIPATPAESTLDGHGEWVARSIHAITSSRGSERNRYNHTMSCTATEGRMSFTPVRSFLRRASMADSNQSSAVKYLHVTPPTLKKSRSPLWQMKTSTVRCSFCVHRKWWIQVIKSMTNSNIIGKISVRHSDLPHPLVLHTCHAV